jgi:hypothetical protein
LAHPHYVHDHPHLLYNAGEGYILGAIPGIIGVIMAIAWKPSEGAVEPEKME